ncbi:MAG: hypothetical protein ACTSQ8_20710, partial [Candidatus Helarchaeota archaeon]
MDRYSNDYRSGITQPSVRGYKSVNMSSRANREYPANADGLLHNLLAPESQVDIKTRIKFLL